jgi:hypothetical protein
MIDYQKLTAIGGIYIKNDKMVVKDPDALLDGLKSISDTMPMRQKIVVCVLGVRERFNLTMLQAMQLWEELDIAAHRRSLW